MSSSSLRFSHSTKHGHLFPSLRHCTEQSRTWRNTLAQASQACSGPAEVAILKGRLSPVGSVGSFCFCSLQEVWVFTSHPHKTRWLPGNSPSTWLFQTESFISLKQTSDSSRQCQLPKGTASQDAVFPGVLPLVLGVGHRCFATWAGRPCECLPCSPVLQLECVWSHQNSGPSVTVTDGVGPQKGRHKVCPHFPSVDWVSLCRTSTTFPPCSHSPPLWFSARS